MQGHGDVDLGRGNEVNRQVPLVKNRKDGHEEAVGTSTLLGVDVKHGNTALDGDSGRTLGTIVSAEADQAAVAEKRRLLLLQIVSLIGPDDGSLVAGVLDILDANGNAGFDDLVHGEGVNDFGPIEGQFGSLGGCDRGQQASSGHFAGVCSKDAINLLPDLQFRGTNADSNESGAEVSVSTTDLSKKTARDVTEVASNNRNGVAAGVYGLCEGASQAAVEAVVNTFANWEVDDIAQVDVLSIAAAILQDGSHVQTRQLLALGDNLVLGTLADLGQVLGGLEDLDQAVALGIDRFRVGFQDLCRRDGILCNDDMVGADNIDYVDIFARANAFGLAGSAKQAVGGALALGVGATRRADDGGAVLLEAGTIRT